jgi:hypothetical protein
VARAASRLNATIATAATYECMSIKVSGAPAPTRTDGARLSYRKSGAAAWRDALDLWYDPRFREYRGSVVLLDPGTRYDFRIETDDGLFQDFAAATRVDVQSLPIAEIVELPAMHNSPLSITSGGTAGGYILIRGAPGVTPVVDGQHLVDDLVQVQNASYIIFHGIRFTRANRNCVLLGAPGANSQRITDIVFDDCEFDGWGSPGGPGCSFAANLQSGIYSHSTNVERITVQRCNIHDPAYGANSWFEAACSGTNHPEGTQGITLRGSQGGHVIRYNTLDGGSAGFNDSMGEPNNFSDAGFPCRDSDIYGNAIGNVWDDGIESEGRDENVRIFHNFFDNVFHAVGIAPVHRGPIYVWGNVGGRSRSGRTANKAYGQAFLKFRRRQGSSGEDWGGGRVYVLDNAMSPGARVNGRGRPDEAFSRLVGDRDSQSDGGLGDIVARSPVVGVDPRAGGPPRFGHRNMAVPLARPTVTKPPSIGGGRSPGTTISLRAGGATGLPQVVRTLKRNGVPIVPNAGPTYALTRVDAGATLTLDVSYTNAAGTTVASSAPFRA